ncbi:MAG: glycerate kinase [Nitrospinota bacterium]
MSDSQDSLKRLRVDAEEIFRAALQAVDPYEATLRHLRLEGDVLHAADQSLACPPRVFVVGFGKAAAPMAQAVEEVLGDRVAGGSVTVKEGHALPLRRVRVVEAAHPIPDARGLAGAEEIVKVLEPLGADDLVVCVISGGGSALLPLPAEGVTLEEKGATTQALMDAGATIHEMNALRKHLSRVKGGRLARLAHPAALVSLVLSDVVGDDADAIASGPTVPDRTTFASALEIVQRRGIRERLPRSVVERPEAGAAGKVPETPKADDPVFRRTRFVLVGNNALALRAAADAAGERGYRLLVLSSCMEGETREVARVHAAIARELRSSGNPAAPPACILSGGETTVTIRGGGKGGRNQEFALAAAIHMDGLRDVLLLSAGTDGTDGPTDAAGAVADGTTVGRAAALGLDPGAALDDNDAYPFFQRLGDLLITGPTRTNVMDVRILLAAP